MIRKITKTDLDGNIISERILTEEEFYAKVNRTMTAFREADARLERGEVSFGFGAFIKNEADKPNY